MYTLPLVIGLTFHGFIILLLILIAFLDSLDNSSESCFSCAFFNICVVFAYKKINKREKHLNMKGLIKEKNKQFYF